MAKGQSRGGKGSAPRPAGKGPRLLASRSNNFCPAASEAVVAAAALRGGWAGLATFVATELLFGDEE